MYPRVLIILVPNESRYHGCFVFRWWVNKWLLTFISRACKTLQLDLTAGRTSWGGSAWSSPHSLQRFTRWLDATLEESVMMTKNISTKGGNTWRPRWDPTTITADPTHNPLWSDPMFMTWKQDVSCRPSDTETRMFHGAKK